MSGNHWLGIDFSGNDKMWEPRCTGSNVWIAEVRRGRRRPLVSDLSQVQKLPGTSHPFDRLAKLLRGGHYLAAGIDAPFSIPAKYMYNRTHRALLKQVGSPECQCPGRPFPKGCRFVKCVTGQCPPLRPKPKPCRKTDKYWKNQKLNVRSTLWAGRFSCAACRLLSCASSWPCRYHHCTFDDGDTSA